MVATAYGQCSTNQYVSVASGYAKISSEPCYKVSSQTTFKFGSEYCYLYDNRCNQHSTHAPADKCKTFSQAKDSGWVTCVNKEKCSESTYFGLGGENMCSTSEKVVSDTAYCSKNTCEGSDESTCCVDPPPPEKCGESSVTCPRGFSRREDKFECASTSCIQKECCVLNTHVPTARVSSSSALGVAEAEDVCLASGECLPDDYSKKTVTPRPVTDHGDNIALTFIATGNFGDDGQPFTLGGVEVENVADFNERSKRIDVQVGLNQDDLTLYDDDNVERSLGQLYDAVPEQLQLICKEEPWVHARALQFDAAAPKRCIIIIPKPLPCWIRRITFRIWGRVYSFPVLGWSRRCCDKKTGGFGWFSNSTGCYSGISGPFLSEAQCSSICGPFEQPDDPCVFGNLTLQHGETTSCHGGTTCTCNDGELSCDNCRFRRKIQELHHNDPDDEARLVRALQWVSDGCDGACNNWLIDILQDHSTYSGHAHGNSKFFPWHRWYLKELEMKLQLYHPCVTIPWWDWTLDRTKTDGNFGWVNAAVSSPLWGDFNGVNNNEMGEFQQPHWEIPPAYGTLGRSSSIASISSLASTTTIANYMARATYGSPSNFRAFEGPHGTPHLLIGGQMGGMRSPSDPLFWIHHAGVDKVWYDWQDLHAPGTDYDADPTVALSPQWPTVTTNDVFDSRNSLGVCYDGTFGVPPARRRRLATAIEYGLIAAVVSPSQRIPLHKASNTLRQLEQQQAMIQSAITFNKDAVGLNNNVCGKSASDCTWKICDGDNADCCMDEMAENMNMDPAFFRENQCVDKRFEEEAAEPSSALRGLLNKADTLKFDACFGVKCTTHSTCQHGKCVCDDGYKLDKHRCVPDSYQEPVCPSGCTSWYDGCNTCSCDGEGQLGHCTKRACFQYEPATCIESSSGYDIDDYDPDASSDVCPAGCNAWYDGCNTCACADVGKLGHCTLRFCAVYEEAKCIDNVCPTGCETWYDGCNTCTCDSKGTLGACTKRFCIQQGNAFCSKYRNKRTTTVKDTLPPVITLAPNSLDLSDDALKDVKPDLLFSKAKDSTEKLNLVLDSTHSNDAIAFNPRVVGFKDNTDNRGYLSLDFLDKATLDKLKGMNFEVTKIVIDDQLETTQTQNNAITFEDGWPRGSDTDFNDVVVNVKDSGNENATIRVGGNGIQISPLPSQGVTVQFGAAGTGRRRLSVPLDRSLHRMLVPIRIADFTKFVFCRIDITVTFGSPFGGTFSFTFTILRTGKQCCDYGTGSGTYEYRASTNTCISDGSGPFHSSTTCANLCVKDSCDLPGPRTTTPFAHGSKFYSCTCNDGHWDEPAGCKHRKEVGDLTDAERTQLIDAMHWVFEGCDGDCGSFQTVHPPSGGTLDWDLIEFFTDHVRYGSDAHGQWKFFPWHRKYLKDFESKLQLFDPCVTIPWWDWTQDVDKTDGNFHKDWITAAGTDWGAISNDNGIVGSGTTDGMKVGRFRCNQGSDSGHDSTPVEGNDWSSGSSTLGNCLWRNSVLSYIGSMPDDAMIADYMSKTSYDGWNALMDFESSPHGTPHVMVGGTGTVRGQMGNGRSPFDPVFWIHHAGVDKLWHDWQHADPSHFNDLGGTGRAAQQLSTQWPATTAGDMLDSEGDLKVCYSEPAPTFIGPIWADLTLVKALAEHFAPAGGRRLLNSREPATRRRLPHYKDWSTSPGVIDIPTDASDTAIENTIQNAQTTENCLNPIPYDNVKEIVSDGGTLAGKTVRWNDMCLDSWYVMMNQDPQHAANVNTVLDWQTVMRNMTMAEKQEAVASTNCKMDNCTQTELKQRYMEIYQC